MSENLLLRSEQFVRETSIRIYNAFLTFYMHIPFPDKLDDIDWAEKLQDLNFIRHREKEASEQK